MNYGILIDQAHRLYTALNNAAYAQACRYARYSSYQPAAETDARMTRLNTLIGRAEQRIIRRLAARRAIRGY